MPIDPLLPDLPPRRSRYEDGTWRDGAAQLLAVFIVIAGMFAVIGVAELVARAFESGGGDESSLVWGFEYSELGVGSGGGGAAGGVQESMENGGGGGESAAGTGAKRYAPASCDWLLPIMEKHGLPVWMSAVAYRESRCLPGVYNGNRSTGDDSYGLFQINALGYLWREVQGRCGLNDRRQLFEAEVNVACAARLYEAYGYKPWDRGKYFK